MQPTREQLEALDAEEIEWARQQSPGEKILAGLDLFDLACEFTKGGIRLQNPDADENHVIEMLQERLELARSLENVSVSFEEN